MIIESTCHSNISDKIKKLTKVNSYNKIYINDKNTIFLNNAKYLGLQLEDLNVNRAFFRENLESIKHILLTKNSFNIKHLYFEIGHNSHVIKYPTEKEALNMNYLHDIANDSFIVSFIDRCKHDDQIFLKNMNRLLSLFDIKKAFYILQYIVAYDVIKLKTAITLLKIFTQKLLDCNEKFNEINNFRYINTSVANLFSLEYIEN